MQNSTSISTRELFFKKLRNVTTQEEHSLYTHRKQQTGYWTEVPGSITREAVM